MRACWSTGFLFQRRRRFLLEIVQQLTCELVIRVRHADMQQKCIIFRRVRDYSRSRADKKCAERSFEASWQVSSRAWLSGSGELRSFVNVDELKKFGISREERLATDVIRPGFRRDSEARPI